MSGDTEIFKDVPGYEGIYEVSNLGRIKSIPRNTTKGGFLSLKALGSGYPQVSLWKDGTQENRQVHRLVALVFVPGFREGLVVNHIDYAKTNNHYTNLEWVTQKDNINHSMDNLVAALAKHYLITHPDGKVQEVYNLNQFCIKNNLDVSALVKVAKGKRTHHKGFKCSYIEEK